MRAGYSRVPHPCATVHCCTVRLACLIHAASVRSEPGSNSPYKKYFVTDLSLSVLFFSLQKKLILEFISNSNFPDRTSTEFASPFNPDPGHSHYSIFQGTPDFSSAVFQTRSTQNRAEQRVLNLAHFFVLSSAIQNLFFEFFSRQALQLPSESDAVFNIHQLAILSSRFH